METAPSTGMEEGSEMEFHDGGEIVTAAIARIACSADPTSDAGAGRVPLREASPSEAPDVAGATKGRVMGALEH